jgi:hypothetical protein
VTGGRRVETAAGLKRQYSKTKETEMTPIVNVQLQMSRTGVIMPRNTFFAGKYVGVEYVEGGSLSDGKGATYTEQHNARVNKLESHKEPI